MKTNTDTISKDFSLTENMGINITSKNQKVTKGIENKILEQVSKLEKFIKGKREVKVSLSNIAGQQKTEMMMDINGSFLKAQAVSENLFESIELATENLKDQLSKYSEKKNSNNRESIKYLEVKSQIEEEKSTEPQIVKRKLISAKPMFEKEALLQMEMLNHRSFIFMNAETNEPCMTYKRHDGDYGIIELV